MSLYNLQEIFESKIKIGYYFDGPEYEKYRITKIINIDSENNFVKVLVVNESKKSNVFGEGCEGYYRVYQEEFIQVSKWYFGKKHRGKIKNQIRYVEDLDGKLYLQVQLPQNQIMITDLKYYGLVKDHIWHVHKNNYRFYARTHLEGTTKCFHQLINPDWSMTDHINRNGLDNREKNLRKTIYRQSALNKKLRKNNKS
ncbi:hypothetical protein C2G38_2231124, partial [Gigaspora rosea]